MDMDVPDLRWIDTFPRRTDDLVTSQSLRQRRSQARVEQAVIVEGPGGCRRREERGGAAEHEHAAAEHGHTEDAVRLRVPVAAHRHTGFRLALNPCLCFMSPARPAGEDCIASPR